MLASFELPTIPGPPQYRIYLATAHPGAFELPQASMGRQRHILDSRTMTVWRSWIQEYWGCICCFHYRTV